MPIINLENPVFISVDGAGQPNSGGTVEVYVADGLFTTYAAVYSDQIKTSALANPVTLDDAGTKEIWFEVKVDIREKTKDGVLIRDTLNIDPNVNASVATSFNLATNGSFEVDSDSDGQPDNWTISPYTGSAIAITTAVVTDGANALEFNTGAAGSGGGTATSAKFPVTEGTVCQVSWSFYATNATTTNTFQIKWYDEDDVLQSTSTITMPASGSVPTSWTNYLEYTTVDAAGTQGEIILTGISSGGSNLSSKAYFDGIIVINQPASSLRGNSLSEPVIYDSSGNEIVTSVKTASAVNNVRITNAATGNAAKIDVSETNTNLEIAGNGTGSVITPTTLLDTNGNEWVTHVATASAVNNVRFTSGTTGNAAVIDVTETNSDLEFTRNGTGEITVDSTPIYGMVIFNTPILLATSTATVSVAKANIDISAYTTGVATKAIVRVQTDSYGVTASSNTMTVRVGEPDETFSSVHDATYVLTDNNGGPAQNYNTVVTNLKTGELFAWEIIKTGTVTLHTTTLHLVGYYV